MTVAIARASFVAILKRLPTRNEELPDGTLVMSALRWSGEQAAFSVIRRLDPF
jgi:hypothetical protein